ncbi:hypothetical protein Tco_0009439 [Tanacetum coccineum]
MNGIIASRVSITNGDVTDCYQEPRVVHVALRVLVAMSQTDEAQSPRVPVPFPENPCEAIRQAYLVETETPESPHTVALPTSLLDSIPPTHHAEDSVDSNTTARMAVRVPPAMSLGLSASIADVAAMSDSAFCKRFRSFYECSPSSSPPDLPLWKHYRGTSELVEDDEEEDDEEDDEEEEDEEVEESSDSDIESEDAEDESPNAEDEDPTAGDEGLAAGVEGPGMRDESLSLGGDEAIPEGQQRTASVIETAVEPERQERVSALRQPILTTWIDPEGDRVYIDVPAYPLPAPHVQTPSLPEWSSGSLPISLAPSVISSPILSPMIPLTVPSPVASPTTAETEGFLTELEARVEMDIGEFFTSSKAVRDEIFTQRYQFKSLEHEQERVAVTFGAIWRPVLALESRAGQTDAQRAALWHAISDTQTENRELRLQIAEERRARLDLAEIVDSMRIGQKPRGDV